MCVIRVEGKNAHHITKPIIASILTSTVNIPGVLARNSRIDLEPLSIMGQFVMIVDGMKYLKSWKFTISIIILIIITLIT